MSERPDTGERAPDTDQGAPETGERAPDTGERLPWQWRNVGERPTPVTILALLLLAKAVVAAAVGLGGTLGRGSFIERLGLPDLLAESDPRVLTVLFLALAVVLGVAALGLLAGRRSGWLVAMVTTGVLIAADIATFGSGTGQHVWILLNIVTVFYLNQRDVRQAFAPAADGGHVVEALP